MAAQWRRPGAFPAQRPPPAHRSPGGPGGVHGKPVACHSVIAATWPRLRSADEALGGVEEVERRLAWGGGRGDYLIFLSHSLILSLAHVCERALSSVSLYI